MRSESMTEDELPSPPIAPPAAWRRRLFACRRTILISILLLVTSYLGYCCYNAHQQIQAVVAIRAMGGRVTYADELPHMRLAWPRNWVKQYIGHDYAVPVVTVQLGGTSVGDNDLDCLRPLSSLQGLWLHRSEISDQGLRVLRSKTSLEDLSLRDTQIGDGGLANLEGLTNLRFLYLHNTQVSDEGLQHLFGLKRLSVVYLAGTRVTDAGAQRLHEALPQVRIRY
jgi:hypothetical protein